VTLHRPPRPATVDPLLEAHGGWESLILIVVHLKAEQVGSRLHETVGFGVAHDVTFAIDSMPVGVADLPACTLFVGAQRNEQHDSCVTVEVARLARNAHEPVPRRCLPVWLGGYLRIGMRGERRRLSRKSSTLPRSRRVGRAIVGPT
jgi:hypothetical protein